MVVVFFIYQTMSYKKAMRSQYYTTAQLLQRVAYAEDSDVFLSTIFPDCKMFVVTCWK